MHHRLDQARARFATYLAHHAEVEVGQATVREGQQVARVGVGVKKAVLQQLLQAAVNTDIHHFVGVNADATHGLEVGEFYPLDPLHGEHPAAGGLVIDAGDGDAGVVGVQGCETFGVGRLIAVVHLLEHPLAQLIDQGHQVAADQAHVLVQPGGDVAHDVEIERDLFAQPRSLHLDRNLLTALEHPFVHLAEGGGGDRFGIELFIDLQHRGTEVILDAGHGQG